MLQTLKIFSSFFEMILSFFGLLSKFEEYTKHTLEWLTNLNPDERQIFILAITFVLIIFLIFLTLLIVLLVVFYKKIISNRNKDSFEMLMESFLNELKNAEYEVEKIHWLEKSAGRDLNTRIKGIINNLSEFLSKHYNQNISVCLKTFIKDTYNLKNAEYFTFCRSENTIHERQGFNRKNDPQKISENSYYNSIICEKEGYFACGHLRRSELIKKFLHIFFKKIEPLKNSHKEYWRKYKSTIIVPIRMDIENKRYKNDEEHECQYEILGFLCIDSKKNMRMWNIKDITPYSKRNRDVWIYYLLSQISNILYCYLEKYKSEQLRIVEFSILNTMVNENTTQIHSILRSKIEDTKPYYGMQPKVLTEQTG